MTKKKLNILGIIPARGGSKGIKKKNLYKLINKPLIEYTINEAIKSKLITDLIVSSDSHEILKISESLGLKTPFIRPKYLSQDNTQSFPVIEHALKNMQKKNGINYDYIIMLQPTTPLRKSYDIDRSLRKLIKSELDSIVSVVNVGANHPFRMKLIKKNQKLVNFIEKGFEDMRPRQNLPPVYIRNGAIYATKTKLLLKNRSIVASSCLAYIMPKYRSVNIDVAEDILLAEYFINNEK